MNNQATLLIVIVAVALALLVIFLEHDVSSVPYQSPERFRVFRGLKQAGVERVSLLARDGATVHLTRSSNRWFFERPLPNTKGYTIKWEADPEAVNRLVDTLVALREADAAVKTAPGARLDMYGLGDLNAAERVEVTFAAENGASIKRKLYLGDAVPDTAGRMYVSLEGDERVLIVEDTLGQMMALAREGGIAFRSRRVFPRGDLVDTDEVELEGESYTAKLEQVAARLWTTVWQDRADGRTYRARGSHEQVTKIAEAMQGLRVEQFVADTARTADFVRFGLNPARVKIVFTLSAQGGGMLGMLARPETADLRIGADVPGKPDQVYAMAQRLPMVFTVKKSFLDSLPKTGKDLPSRRLVTFASSAVKTIALRNKAGKLRANKVKWDWKLLQPMRIDGDASVIDALIKAVVTTDCKDLVWEGRLGLRDFGLTAPSATLTLYHEVKSDEGEKRRLTERIQFGRVLEPPVEEGKKEKSSAEDTKKPAATRRIYVRRVGDTAVRIYDLAGFEAVTKPPLHFFAKQVLEFDAFEAESLTFTRPDGRFTFVKQGQDWLMTSPASLKADAGHIGGLVASASWLSAAEIVATNTDELSRFGLDKPTHRLDVVVKEKPDDAEKKPDAEKPGEEKSPEKKADEKKADGKQPGEKNGEKPDDAAAADAKIERETITLILAVRAEGEKKQVFGHVPGNKLIFRLEDGFEEKLETEPADTDIFPFQWNIRAGRTEAGGRIVRLTRDADGNVYQVAEGADGKLLTADAKAGQKFFATLGGTKVQKRYLDYESKNLTPFGLDKDPYAVITSTDKEEKTITLEVGATADPARHGKGLRYARRKGQTAVFLVKQDDLDALLKPAAGFLPAGEDKKAKDAEAGPPAPGQDNSAPAKKPAPEKSDNS